MNRHALRPSRRLASSNVSRAAPDRQMLRKVGVVNDESEKRLEEERNEVEYAVWRQEAQRKVVPGGNIAFL